MQTLYELGCNKKLLLESINLISLALKIEVQAVLDIQVIDILHLDYLLIEKDLFLILHVCWISINVTLLMKVLPGNTEVRKCQLTNEYPFFLFLIGRW